MMSVFDMEKVVARDISNLGKWNQVMPILKKRLVHKEWYGEGAERELVETEMMNKLQCFCTFRTVLENKKNVFLISHTHQVDNEDCSTVISIFDDSWTLVAKQPLPIKEKVKKMISLPDPNCVALICEYQGNGAMYVVDLTTLGESNFAVKTVKGFSKDCLDAIRLENSLYCFRELSRLVLFDILKNSEVQLGNSPKNYDFNCMIKMKSKNNAMKRIVVGCHGGGKERSKIRIYDYGTRELVKDISLYKHRRTLKQWAKAKVEETSERAAGAIIFGDNPLGGEARARSFGRNINETNFLESYIDPKDDSKSVIIAGLPNGIHLISSNGNKIKTIQSRIIYPERKVKVKWQRREDICAFLQLNNPSSPVFIMRRSNETFVVDMETSGVKKLTERGKEHRTDDETREENMYWLDHNQNVFTASWFGDGYHTNIVLNAYRIYPDGNVNQKFDDGEIIEKEEEDEGEEDD